MDTDSVVAPPDLYTVYARSTPFLLTHSQLLFDSPNHFTAAFLSHDFHEASSRTLNTDRHPLLFSLIVEHLSGYDILPLRLDALPPTMTLETGLDNLLRDAEYFSLSGLEKKLREVKRLGEKEDSSAASRFRQFRAPYEMMALSDYTPDGEYVVDSMFYIHDVTIWISEVPMPNHEFPHRSYVTLSRTGTPKVGTSSFITSDSSSINLDGKIKLARGPGWDFGTKGTPNSFQCHATTVILKFSLLDEDYGVTDLTFFHAEARSHEQLLRDIVVDFVKAV